MLQNPSYAGMIIKTPSGGRYHEAYPVFQVGSDGVSHRLRRPRLLRHLLSRRNASGLPVPAGVHSLAGALRLRHRLPADPRDVLAGKQHRPPVEKVLQEGAEASLRRAAPDQHTADRGGGALPAVPADERADPPAGGQRHHPHQQRRILLPQRLPLGGLPAGQRQRDRRLDRQPYHRPLLRRHGVPHREDPPVGAEGGGAPDQRHLERYPRRGGLRLRPHCGSDRLHLSDGHEGKEPCPLLQGGLRLPAREEGGRRHAGHTPRQRHLLRLRPGQAAGLPHYRHPLLHLLLPAEAALHAAGQRGGGRHQRDPLLRPLPGGDPLRVSYPAGQSQAVPRLCGVYHRSPAV